jgi:hypothetical protein
VELFNRARQLSSPDQKLPPILASIENVSIEGIVRERLAQAVFLFQDAIQSLGFPILIAMILLGHADAHLTLFQLRDIFPAAILTAPIGVTPPADCASITSRKSGHGRSPLPPISNPHRSGPAASACQSSVAWLYRSVIRSFIELS